MDNRTGRVYHCGSNKGFNTRFYVDSPDQHETLEEGQKTYSLKRCDYNNKYEVRIFEVMIIYFLNPQEKTIVLLAVGGVVNVLDLRH